jgi:hypothetical protein
VIDSGKPSDWTLAVVLSSFALALVGLAGFMYFKIAYFSKLSVQQYTPLLDGVDSSSNRKDESLFNGSFSHVEDVEK